MTVINVALTLSESSDPPVAFVVVTMDGKELVRREFAPGEAANMLATIAPEAKDIWQPAVDLVARLEEAVEQGRAAQSARSKALTAWKAVLPE